MTEPTSAPTGVPAHGPAAKGLSPQDEQALVDATRLAIPLRKAAGVGNFNGALYSIFGMLSLMFALGSSPDMLGLSIGAALLAIGLFERSAARRLRTGGPRAALHLAQVELAALGVVVIYCLIQMFGVSQLGEEVTRHSSMLKEFGLDTEALAEQLTFTVYPTVIATSVIVQGLVARYFLRKRADVERYVDEVPDWARKLLESVGESR